MSTDETLNQGLQAPHGPGAAPLHTITEYERQIFDYLIRPDDSYDSTGTYWADMPIAKRIKFVTNYDNKETAREFGSFLSMAKRNPFAPIAWYFRNAVLPGAGLGLEGYVLFSIGNIKPLFTASGGYPECWGASPTVCNVTWTQAVDYLEISGIIVGQILVGYIGDAIGRRWGLIQDAAVMLFGLILLTSAWATTLNGWVIFYVWSLFIYGIGVGGEYPMTATSGMENAVGSGKISTKEDRLHRGRKVTMAFLMQGWGQFLDQSILICFLLWTHHLTGEEPYGHSTIQATYRASFAIPAIGTAWLVYYRAFKMPSANKHLLEARKKSGVTGYSKESLHLTTKYFGSRLIATAGSWYANDIFFYGNKLFQSEFIAVVAPSSKTNILPGWEYNLLNTAVSLAGYYLASFLIDNKLYGRRNMQQIGFLMDFILFVIPAFHFQYYSSAAGANGFQAMYYLSSFFNQFGPNSVTFLVAAECYPTQIRASAHGFSAAVGKLGALTAAILYNYIDPQVRFYVVPWFGLVGMFLTWLFLPDTTGLDLKEQERRWHYIVTGREHLYHGPAVHPHHLSLWERFRGVGKYYDAEKDYRSKIDEMRGEWEEQQASKNAAEEKDQTGVHQGDDDDGVWSSDVSTYFAQSVKGGPSPEIKPGEKVLDPEESSPERV